MKPKHEIGDVINFISLPSELRELIISEAAPSVNKVVVHDISHTHYGLIYPLKNKLDSTPRVRWVDIRHMDNPEIHDYIPKVKYASAMVSDIDLKENLIKNLETPGVICCEVRKDRHGSNRWYELHYKINKDFPNEEVWKTASPYIPY